MYNWKYREMNSWKSTKHHCWCINSKEIECVHWYQALSSAVDFVFVVSQMVIITSLYAFYMDTITWYNMFTYFIEVKSYCMNWPMFLLHIQSILWCPFVREFECSNLIFKMTSNLKLLILKNVSMIGRAILYAFLIWSYHNELNKLPCNNQRTMVMNKIVASSQIFLYGTSNLQAVLVLIIIHNDNFIFHCTFAV